jgi:hypothetical protein
MCQACALLKQGIFGLKLIENKTYHIKH